MVAEEKTRLIECKKCRIETEEKVCRTPYTICRMVAKEHVKCVPHTTCKMEAYCETTKVCRRVRMCVPISGTRTLPVVGTLLGATGPVPPWTPAGLGSWRIRSAPLRFIVSFGPSL